MKTINAALKQEPIAIIGMSCRFPKSASLPEFWELLKNGEHTITKIPKTRWDVDAYYDSDPDQEGKTNQQHASLLTGIHDFDPLFFNISPAEASEMSPSQKLILELAWEAIENTNLPFTAVKDSNTGVFMGNIWSDFEHYRKSRNAKVTLHSALGMAANVVANRVSFTFGFKGPSMVIDTGCSASLVALHLACQSLLNQESAMAMVGGVNHLLDPDRYVDLSRFGGLSATGRCSSFDESADGFVRAEGGCVLLLKRLSDAERDGNTIHALIRGSAVNNNGYNDTLPATSIAGQLELFEKAYRSAGMKPDEVHYVEAHGTGTRKGDPNEVKAMGAFFGEGRKGPKLRIGSVKTNIGHTEAAAGIAGLLKVVLAMQYKMLPATLNFNQPNKDIPFDLLPVEVQTEYSPWPVKDKETFKAGLNSFGWGGTNAHVVLEEYRSQNHKKEVAAAAVPKLPGMYCLPLSAKSPAALKDYAAAYAQEIAAGNEAHFKDLCLGTALRKPSFNYRKLLVGSTSEQLLADLHDFIAADAENIPYSALQTKPKVVFIFPGQGGQFLGMGLQLFKQEQVFRNAILACDAAFFPFSGWSLMEEMMSKPEHSNIHEIDVIQPAICAMQIALAKLLMSWGIQPQMVLGHSMGEVAAAHISGALNLEDAAKIICGRSQLMKTVTGQNQGMLLTELNITAASKLSLIYPGLSVAVVNSYRSTVLSGPQEELNELMKALEQQGIFCRLVRVDVASHSQQMDPLKAALKERLQEIRPQQNVIPFRSTVFNKLMSGTDLDADYWVDNLREAVQFAPAVEQLMEEDYTIFIEINPHPVLINALTDCAEHQHKEILAVGTMQRDRPELAAIVKNLGSLYANGYPIDWKCFYGHDESPDVTLPVYPFQRECYAIEDFSAKLKGSQAFGRPKFPLLGTKIPLAQEDRVHYWSSVLELAAVPHLRHDLSDGELVLPISCYIEMVIEAVAESLNPVAVEIRQLSFSNELRLTANSFSPIQIKLIQHGMEEGEIYIFKKDHEGTDWMQLVHGFLSFSGEVKSDVEATDRKYILSPMLLDQFLHPLYSELSSRSGSGTPLELKFISMEAFQLFQELNNGTEFRVNLQLHSFELLDPLGGKCSFNAELRVLDPSDQAVLNIIGLKGVAEPKKEPLHFNPAEENRLSFLEKYWVMELENDRQQALEQLIMQQVAQVIKASINAIRNTMIFKEMGVDSLMAVQLRNLLEKQLEIKLPVGLFWSHPSIKAYAGYVRNTLEMPATGAGEALLELKHSWFVIPKPNPEAHFRVFCFHDAGGTATLFQGWEKTLDPSAVELVLLEIPEQIRKIENSTYGNLKLLVQELMPFLMKLMDKPCLFLGHSMGGILAYEITREMGRRNISFPKRLIFSSVPEPEVYDNKELDYRVLLNEELGLLYPHLNRIEDLGVRDLFMELLRADLNLLYHYEFIKEAPLDIPIIAVHGMADEGVKAAQMKAWERQTSAGFKLISRPGGHRFIEGDAEFLTHLIKEEIKALG